MKLRHKKYNILSPYSYQVAINKRIQITNVGEDVEKREPLLLLIWQNRLVQVLWEKV